jgi:undecaprenyl diphosphate synthase
MTTSAYKELRVNIKGRVQAVFFRDTAKLRAKQLGLVGYTQNNNDGSVDIVAQGTESPLRELLDWCYRGSLLSEVTGLSFDWESIEQCSYHSFTINKKGRGFFRDKLHAVTNAARVFLKGNNAPEEQQEAKHVVIIPDGNRRWARERNLPVWEGHKKGLSRLEEIIPHLKETSITHLTVWGFSTDNWKRNEKEVQSLMHLFEHGLSKLAQKISDAEVSFHHIGRKDRLPKKLLDLITQIEEDTKHHTEQSVILALDYGGKDELLRAINKLENKEHVEMSDIDRCLDTQRFPDPDLIIRTSGEQRLSGLMTWQSAHAELYFSPVLFPDFDIQQLTFALDEFSRRKRRFGS